MDHLASEATGITLRPVVEQGQVIGGIDTAGSATFVSRWTIKFETLRGRFAYEATTLAGAVEEAWANSGEWR